jgi:predicted DNA-binding transcriptional regulator YafY
VGDGLTAEELLATISEAITSCRIVRLGYSRKADGVLSLHHIAPIDVQRGDTPRTRGSWYLWAYCVEEARLERHLIDRILSVTLEDETFDPPAILDKWPDGWPRPPEWVIPRNWTSR